MSDNTPPPGLRGVGGPLAGTDARPADDRAETPGERADLGGDNAFEDARLAHAKAQASDTPVTDALEDTRASSDTGSASDDDAL